MRIERLPLKKLNNTRDLGGFPAEDGKKIKFNRFIRSGKLYNLPPETVEALKKAGVSTIIDMRTDKEREEYPSTEIEGVKYYHLPLVCTATTGITHTRSMAGTMLKESKRIKKEFGNTDNYMKSMYEIILFDPDCKARLSQIIKLIIQEENCILWHCNGGKDRTGIVAMLIESLLGVDEELIIEDYVSSNRFQKTKRGWQKFGLRLSPIPRRFKHILYALMNAEPQYITNALQAIKNKCGSVVEYCKTELNITDEEIQLLKDKNLE